jgi:hypothetical protein
MKTISNTIVLIVTIAINIFLIEALYWLFAYSLATYPLITPISVLAICAVVATTVIMIVRYFKNKPFFRTAPILTFSISAVLGVAIIINQAGQPNATHYYTDGAYEFKEEQWHDDDGYIIRVRRSKSPKGNYFKWEIDTEYTKVPHKIEGY